MIIDEERLFTPYFIENMERIYTDHYGIKCGINWKMEEGVQNDYPFVE